MGFFSKVGSAIRGGLRQIVDVVKEIANRIFGIVDLLASLIGILLPKKLRLRVVILRDETGSFLATAEDVEPAIERAKAIFKTELNTTIVAAGGKMVERVDPMPPTAALNPGCGFDAWKDDFGDAGDFYSLHIATNLSAAPTGYATPVTAFIVRNVRGKKGCSLGPLTNYVTLDLDGIDTITVGGGDDDVSATIGRLWLAHEIAHSCGLWHVKKKANLMHPTAEDGVDLRNWQKAIARNSRHISFL